MNSVLVGVAFGCFLLGALIDTVFGVRIRSVRALPYLLGLIGSACLFVLGAHAAVSRPTTVNIVLLSGAGDHALHIDQLAGLFLTLLFGLAIAVSASFISWVGPTERVLHRGTAVGYLLLLSSVATIVCAANAFLFLFSWELLTLSFYLLSSITRSSRRQTGAAWSTVGMGKFSGAALLFAFLLLAGRTGNLALASWHVVGQGALHDVVWVLVVAGFGAKLGVVPFQVWIPLGYPAAPGPARAAMAGIAANVGVYGLWRFLGILGYPPVWLVISVLICGGVTALLGITFAGVQSTLTRVVSYSSIENAGLILTAFGVALTGSIVHSSAFVALGLLAATLQTATHAIAKSALFVAAANVEAVEGSDDLDQLRGVGRRMSWSGTTFGAGALALAGLPPTLGFVSEWFILEALMQQFRVAGLALRLALAISAALVALTTGLAALVFLRLLALTFLGKSSASRERLSEFGILNKVGLSILGAGCLVGAALSPLEVRFIASGLTPIVPKSVTLHALKSPWVLQPVFSGFSILSPSWLWVILPTAIVTVLLATLVLSSGRVFRVRRVAAWHSATSGVSGSSSYTAFGFANPLRHVLSNILGTSKVVSSVSDEHQDTSSQRELIESRSEVVEPVETYLYRPLRSAVVTVAKVAKRLQSGRLNAYVAYMMFALLAVLTVVATMR